MFSFLRTLQSSSHGRVPRDCQANAISLLGRSASGCSTFKRLTGFTLLEVLIATAVTLLLMLGLAQVFKVLGDSITKGRAGLELNNRLRNVIHRIRTDLDNVTVIPTPPIKVGAGQGYLKYYDGPGADYSPMAFNPADLSRLFPEGYNAQLSRFGDLDDVFMATIKAQDAWFTGRVPSFLLDRNPATPINLADADGNGIIDALEDTVVISSQFAEVIIFAEPLPTTRNLVSPDPTAVNIGRDPIRLAADPVAGFEDSFLGGDSFPDGFRLHYRLLLIRPDLNLSSGLLKGAANADPRLRAMVAGPEWLTPEFQVQPPPNPVPPGYLPIVPFASSANRITLPSPMCDMWRIHQFCDLSVRRVYNAADGFPDQDFVAANSLEDLANPINRFAHFSEPLNNANTYASMPILALSPPMAFQQACLNHSGVVPRANFFFSAGFLHPVFTLMGRRAGEDILANDLLAFDIKVFDSSAPIIAHNGPDNLVLRPGDPAVVRRPGFQNVLVDHLNSPAVVQATGEFVDVNWGGKAAWNYSSEFAGVSLRGVSSTFPDPFALPPNTITVRAIYPPSLLKSGLVKFDNDARTPIFQPSYDTFTDLYERDGLFQAQINGPGTALSLSGGLADQGTDGVDSNGDGTADDIGERETSPPFATNLRGIQISVRLEDRATKQFKQMSTVKEFITR